MGRDKFYFFWAFGFFKTKIFHIALAVFLVTGQLASEPGSLKLSDLESHKYCENEIEHHQIEFHERDKRKIKTTPRHRSLVHARDRIERSQAKIEVAHLKNLLSKLDDLYGKLSIKVQKIGERNELGPEQISDLYRFLSGPEGLDEIISIAERELRRRLTNIEIEKLRMSNHSSFADAVRLLWKSESISDSRARTLINKYSPMTANEILKLIDLGATRTSSGYLVQLKTGAHFGDPLRLFDEFYHLSKKYRHAFADELLYDSIPDDVFDAIREFTPSADDIIFDARIISEIRRHFEFLSRINLPMNFKTRTIDFRLDAQMSIDAPVNFIDYYGVAWSPSGLNAVLLMNDHFLSSISSLTNSAMFLPPGISPQGYDGTAGGMGWWMSFTDKYLGIGGTYTVNFANGAFWSNGASTAGVSDDRGAGWRNYLTSGFSLMTMLGTAVGDKAHVLANVSRDYDINYQGQYPMDGRFAEIRRLHKIEIVDRKGIAALAAGSANLSNQSDMVAFHAGPAFTLSRIYRTHEDLERTQHVLNESEISSALFLLGKNIKETNPPSFDRPDNFKVGDEFVEIKIGKLSGAFIMGIQSQIPIDAVNWGTTVELNAEFELALRKLPGEKYEVSIEPKRIFDMELLVNILMAPIGDIESLSFARKQSFIFDFNVAEGRIAYRNLIDHGMLPATADEIGVYNEERSPEFLLTEFRAQNEILKTQGVARSYVEQVAVSSDKHEGLNSRLLSGLLQIAHHADKEVRSTKERLKLSLSGTEREFIQAQSKSIATNGWLSVRRFTTATKKNEGQRFNSRYSEDIYVSHRRIHTIDDSSRELFNKWQFDSLLVHAQLEDTIISGNQENQIADKINKLFSAFIGSFEQENAKVPRVINLERELSAAHLDVLTRAEAKDRIDYASQITEISPVDLSSLLNKLKNKRPDDQAQLVKQFIENHGLSGFAAIHQLLGARPEDLHLRTSGYISSIMQGKTFIAKYSSGANKDNEPLSNLVPKKSRKNKKLIREFYNSSHTNLRKLDKELRSLHDDPFLIDDKSYLNDIYGKRRVNDLVASGVRQDKKALRDSITYTRRVILDLMDLEQQGFSEKDRKKIYKMAGKKRIGLNEALERFVEKYEFLPITTKRSKGHLRKRFRRSWEMITQIEEHVKRLNADDVMRRQDQEYVEKTIQTLDGLRARVVGLVNIDHLSAKEKEGIRKKVGKDLFEKCASVQEKKVHAYDANISLSEHSEMESDSDSLSFGAEDKIGTRAKNFGNTVSWQGNFAPEKGRRKGKFLH
jgi:hypothetical protein